jgi:hypothetical protein
MVVWDKPQSRSASNVSVGAYTQREMQVSIPMWPDNHPLACPGAQHGTRPIQEAAHR